jgi:hypothetical protein
MPSRQLPLAKSKFNHRSKAERLASAAGLLSLSIDGFTPAQAASVIMATNALYHRKKTPVDFSEADARQLCRAFGVVVADDADMTSLHYAISLRFLDSVDIAALSDEVLTSADFNTLCDWADTLGVPHDSEVTGAELIEIINQARTPPHETYTIEVLARLSTPSMKNKFRYFFPEGDDGVTRDVMIGKLLHKRSVDGMSIANELSVGEATASVVGPTTNSLLSLDAMFTSGLTVPPDWSTVVYRLPLPFVKVGNILLLVEQTITTPFQVVSISPVVVTAFPEGETSPVVQGSLTAIDFVWAVSASGLLKLAPALGNAPLPCVAGVPAIFEIPSSPSVNDLLGPSSSASIPVASIDALLGHVGGRSHSRGSSLLNQTYPSQVYPSGNEPSFVSGGLAQQDRTQELRGVQSFFNDPDKVYSATNGTGKYTTDSAFNHFIMHVGESDRSLPAAQKKFLSLLVSLRFGLEYDADKPSGIHLRAFSENGKSLSAIWQIRDALANMIHMMDDLRSPIVPGSLAASQPRFFESLFSGWIQLLGKGDHMGLKDLPPSQVLALLSNKLLVLGCLANSPASDSWSSESEQRAAMLGCLEIDVSREITLAASRAWKAAPSVGKSGSTGNSQTPSRGGGRGGGRGGRGGRGGSPASGGSNSPSVVKAPTVPSPSSSSSSPSAPLRALCISALMLKYKQGSGCTRLASCQFDHDMGRNTKQEERRAAGNMASAVAKQALLTAIG